MPKIECLEEKDCSWLPFNKHAMNIFIQSSTKESLLFSFRSLLVTFESSACLEACLSWRTGEHLHVFHLFHVLYVLHVTYVLQTYSMFSNPGLQDLTSSAALQTKEWKKAESHNVYITMRPRYFFSPKKCTNPKKKIEWWAQTKEWKKAESGNDPYVQCPST